MLEFSLSVDLTFNVPTYKPKEEKKKEKKKTEMTKEENSGDVITTMAGYYFSSEKKIDRGHNLIRILRAIKRRAP